MTHVLLGQLTAAKRSTVTLAVSDRESRDLIRRNDDGAWLITSAGAAMIDAITAPRDGTRSLGEALMLRLRAFDPAN